MKLLDLLFQTAQYVMQNEQSFIVAGNNGPYGDTETRIRNVSHWTIFLSSLYKLTLDPQLVLYIERLLTNIWDERFRPLGYTILNRSSAGKDQCNGLIGQAWVIEALCEAGAVLGRRDCFDFAAEIFLLHPFDDRYGLWQRVEVDGQILSFDATFNHQLWFASCSAMIQGKDRSKIEGKVSCFLDHVEENLTLLEEGIIYHPIESQMYSHSGRGFGCAKRQMRKVFNALKLSSKSSESQLISKSIGYHAFNLYALSCLKKVFPSHGFWESKKFKKALSFSLSEEFKQLLEGNIFGYPYNPVGFEMPIAISTFTNFSEAEVESKCRWWIREQLSRHYNGNSFVMDIGVSDPYTSTARMYEILRLPDNLINEISV